MESLKAWESFYILAGSAAGALIGLQFVLIALIAEAPGATGMGQAVGAFSTPTIIQFTATLLISAILSAPWSGTREALWLCGIIGVAGAVYTLFVARTLGSQKAYHPELSDWVAYFLLPLAAYAGLAVCAWAGADHERRALFGIGGMSLLLLLIGIRNSWDSVTYHVFVQRPGRNRRSHA